MLGPSLASRGVAETATEVIAARTERKQVKCIFEAVVRLGVKDLSLENIRLSCPLFKHCGLGWEAASGYVEGHS